MTQLKALDEHSANPHDCFIPLRTCPSNSEAVVLIIAFQINSEFKPSAIRIPKGRCDLTDVPYIARLAALLEMSLHSGLDEY